MTRYGKAVKEIQSTCRVRDVVYNYGLRHMENPSCHGRTG